MTQMFSPVVGDAVRTEPGGQRDGCVDRRGRRVDPRHRARCRGWPPRCCRRRTRRPRAPEPCGRVTVAGDGRIVGIDSRHRVRSLVFETQMLVPSNATPTGPDDAGIVMVAGDRHVSSGSIRDNVLDECSSRPRCSFRRTRRRPGPSSKAAPTLRGDVHVRGVDLRDRAGVEVRHPDVVAVVGDAVGPGVGRQRHGGRTREIPAQRRDQLLRASPTRSTARAAPADRSGPGSPSAPCGPCGPCRARWTRSRSGRAGHRRRPPASAAAGAGARRALTGRARRAPALPFRPALPSSPRSAMQRPHRAVGRA